MENVQGAIYTVIRLSSSRAFINQVNMKKYLSSKKGFTLVEVLVVMVIVLVVGSIIIGVLFAAARKSNKASSLDVVKRNGNYAIEQMAKTIRYAAKFDGVSIANENGEDINTIYGNQLYSSYNYLPLLRLLSIGLSKLLSPMVIK